MCNEPIGPMSIIIGMSMFRNPKATPSPPFAHWFEGSFLPRCRFRLRTTEHIVPARTKGPIKPRLSLRGCRELVLRLRFEVAGIVPLVELIRGIAAQPVDLAAPFHRRALADQRRPALQILIILHLQEVGAPYWLYCARPPYHGQIATSAIV